MLSEVCVAEWPVACVGGASACEDDSFGCICSYSMMLCQCNMWPFGCHCAIHM
jgi:hypothetical protein